MRWICQRLMKQERLSSGGPKESLVGGERNQAKKRNDSN